MCVVYISWKILTKHGTIFWPRRGKKHHQNLLFSIRGGLLLEKRSPKPYFTGLRTGLLCSFKFYRTAIIRNSSLSLIKRQSKFILLKFRNTTSNRFGINHCICCAKGGGGGEGCKKRKLLPLGKQLQTLLLIA